MRHLVGDDREDAVPRTARCGRGPRTVTSWPDGRRRAPLRRRLGDLGRRRVELDRQPVGVAYATAAPTNAGEQRVRPGRAGSSAPGAPGWPRRTGARSRSSSTNSTSRPSGEVPEITQPGLGQRVPVGVVHLVPVPVPLGDLGRVRTPRPRASPGVSVGRVGAQPHGAAQVALAGDDVLLVGHGGDDRVRRRRASNSGELAPARPARWRATSIVMHCRPRHRPRVGMPFSRAYRAAPILPSMPRTPKPPGITTPSTPARAAAAPVGRVAVVAGHPAELRPGRGGRSRPRGSPRSPTGRRRAGRRTCRPARR